MKTKTIIHFFQLFLITETLVDAMEIRRLFKKKEFSKRKHSHCYCGESNPLGTRIIGGKQTKPDQIPWQALIFAGTDLCGGSVISDRYILTAGHCCYDDDMKLLQISSLSVILGVYDDVKMNRGTEMKYKVIKRTVHPQFKSIGTHDIRDLALLKVDKKIKFNEHIKPICLPNKGTRTSFDGKLAEVSGWGTTVFTKHGDGKASAILLKTNVRVLTDKQCLKTKVGEYFVKDVDSMFCAYGLHKDACLGDSGGPLTVRSSKGVMTLIGLVSWGQDCGLIDYPGVYTRLSTFHDWIRKNTKDSTYCRPKK